MRNLKIVLIYKHSSLAMAGRLSQTVANTARFKSNHEKHYATLQKVELSLKAMGLSYCRRVRGSRIDYAKFDLVITVGGDGTVLEAGRHLNERQLILGVNSDPDWSVGKFCYVDAQSFPKILERIVSNKAKLLTLYKMDINLFHGDVFVKGFESLNDILVCHHNPAAMSRYELTVNGITEEHRSSGLWLSTAAGSTGAIKSAGGKIMPITSTNLQYMPRELYYGKGKNYQLTGGLVQNGKKITITSYMPHGRIYSDGYHIQHHFPYGYVARVAASRSFIQLVHA